MTSSGTALSALREHRRLPPALFTSPRLRGEVDAPTRSGGVSGEGDFRSPSLLETPPHPNPLPHQGVYARLRRAMGERERTALAAPPALRSLAIALVIGAAALQPAPARAETVLRVAMTA